MPYVDPEAKRAYQREWVARRRAAWFADKACIDCGSTEDLEIDHLDPADKVSHRIWSWSKARIETETAKCVVRCTVCHAERHEVLWTTHGIARYEHRGCRCAVCRAAKSEKNRRGRERRVMRAAASH